MTNGEMDLDLVSIEDTSPTGMVSLFNESFQRYLVDVDLTTAQFTHIMRVDSVDVAASRVLREAGEAVGIALVARRGWTARVAAMGIVPSARGRGVGTWLLHRLLEEARERGDRTMVLEVIEQNRPALRLYHGAGFRVKRRLVGYVGSGIETAANEEAPTERIDLEEVDPREVAHLLAVHGAEDLPWQLSADSLAGYAAPARAFRGGPAYAVLSDSEAETIHLITLLVLPTERRKGNARKLMRGLARRFPDRVWGVRVILPEELCPGLFESLGFVRSHLTQFEMERAL